MLIEVPDDVGRDGRAFIAAVIDEFEIELHQAAVLLEAARCLDRCAAAREAISRDGIVQRNAKGELVEHPAARIERASSQLFLRLRRELGVDTEPAGDAPRGNNGRGYR